jgi:hypothetical protein
MDKCWAACLGDCSDKLSREHVITEGVFLSDDIKVKGLPWCRDDFKVIGLPNLVRKNLCVSHNSRLSELDNAAIDLRKAICSALDLSNSRTVLPPANWKIETFSVDGPRLERWFLKTLLSDAFGGEHLIGSESTQPGEPPPNLVKAAFGLARYGHQRAGLYWMGVPGQFETYEGVTFTTFLGKTHRLEGARFWFWGLEFVLALDEEGPIGRFSFTNRVTGETIEPTTTYRPRRLGMSVQSKESHVIEFKW